MPLVKKDKRSKRTSGGKGERSLKTNLKNQWAGLYERKNPVFGNKALVHGFDVFLKSKNSFVSHRIQCVTSKSPESKRRGRHLHKRHLDQSFHRESPTKKKKTD